MIHIITEYQSLAETYRLEYDADLLSRVFEHHYLHYVPTAIQDRISSVDYVCCRMNELMETMIGYYGRNGGGRSQGRHY